LKDPWRGKVQFEDDVKGDVAHAVVVREGDARAGDVVPSANYSRAASSNLV
jgi:hypothetical protein